MAEAGVLTLKGVIQHYEWGGRDFIPELLGISNAAREPFAEWWVGAHPKAPSMVQAGGSSLPLDRLISDAPDTIVGPTQAHFGGRLPYLLKVLDVAKMLSIQAHPNKAQAREGFARENKAGIPISSAERNYKDENHKPEIGVALTDFWMLHGFRSLDEIVRSQREVPELCSVMPHLSDTLAYRGRDPEGQRELLRELYREVMTMPQERVNTLLGALLERLNREGPSDKDRPDYWVMRAAEDFPQAGGNFDRGIFSIYLLNLVRLRPGQGTFQPAGVLHAYLEGVNVELMANSDNVLRGGLTPKHVDVPELLKVLRFESEAPRILDGECLDGVERVYRTAAEEFELSRIEVVPGVRYNGQANSGPETMIVLNGSVKVSAAGREMLQLRGSAFLAPFGTSYAIDAQAGPAVLFKAAVPA